MKAKLTARASILIVAGVFCTGLLASAAPVPIANRWDTSLHQRHEPSVSLPRVLHASALLSPPVLSNASETLAHTDHEMQTAAPLTQPEPLLDGSLQYAHKRANAEEIEPRGFTNAANDIFGATDAESGAVAHVTEEQLSVHLPSERGSSSSSVAPEEFAVAPKQSSASDIVGSSYAVAKPFKGTNRHRREAQSKGLTDRDMDALERQTPLEVKALTRRLNQRRSRIKKQMDKAILSRDFQALAEVRDWQTRYLANLDVIEAKLGRKLPASAIIPALSEFRRARELHVANNAVSDAFKDKIPDWYNKQINAAVPGSAQLPHARHSSSPEASSNSVAPSAASDSSYQDAHQAPTPNTQGSALPASSAEPLRQDSPPPWSPGTFDLSDIEDLS